MNLIAVACSMWYCIAFYLLGSTLEGTWPYFVHWRATLEGNFIMFCPMPGHYTGHFITFYPLEGYSIGCFVHWKGTLEGFLSLFFLSPLEGTEPPVQWVQYFLCRRGIDGQQSAESGQIGKQDAAGWTPPEQGLRFHMLTHYSCCRIIHRIWFE